MCCAACGDADGAGTVRERVMLPLNTMTADAASALEKALPYATVRPTGNQYSSIGGTDDIEQARRLLDFQDQPKKTDPMMTDVVVLRNAPANQIAVLIKTMIIGLKAEAVGQPDKPGGVIGLAGTQTQLTKQRRDQSAGCTDHSTAASKSYTRLCDRYSSAPDLLDFMTKAAPMVTTLIGPETYAPLAPGFKPLSALRWEVQEAVEAAALREEPRRRSRWIQRGRLDLGR